MHAMLISLALCAAPAGPKPFDPRLDEVQRLRTRGLTDAALELLGTVEADARKKKDPVSLGRAQQKRGDLHLDAQRCDDARASYDAAIKTLEKADPIACAQSWNDVGMWAKRCASPEVQKVAFGNALRLYEKVRYPKGIRLVSNNLGSAAFVGGDVKGALPYFQKAAKAARALGDDEAWLTVQANVALMELLLSQERLGGACTGFTAAQQKDAGFQRARAAFKEAAQVSVRAGGTPLSVCAKFGGDYWPLCEPCLINTPGK